MEQKRTLPAKQIVSEIKSGTTVSFVTIFLWAMNYAFNRQLLDDLI
jgi:hypothetical protein